MQEKGTFEIRENFYLNGEPIRLISGGIHYFRVVPEYWRDRLEKLRAMGCNTVETYIAWNEHEPEEGQFHFEGRRDIRRFVELAGELGLYVIIRPSPYICAEWEFGGFPYWLLTKEGIRLRTNNKVYLECVDRFYKELFGVLAPLQVTHGGPILMMQIENEYGSYGNDKDYLRALQGMMRKYGIDVPLFTADGPRDYQLRNGSLPDVLPTANFGSRAREKFSVLREYLEEQGYGKKPLMCMEFWAGWFDAWGCGEHHTSDLEGNKKDLRDLLELGNVNFYMFHGGTSFGFMSGSNYEQYLTPDVTSYDYDAPLSEDGSITEKYRAFREIISEFTAVPEMEFTTVIRKKAYGTVLLKEKVSLSSVLEDISTPVHRSCPCSMEELGQGYGYILYRTQLEASEEVQPLRLIDANDRALIFADQERIAVQFDTELGQECLVPAHSGQLELDILMENMGRVNYGAYLEKQKKGICGGVWLNDFYQMGWDMYSLPLDAGALSRIDFTRAYQEGTPAFYRFELEAEELGDTWISVDGFGKGCIFVNGTNLGRYWEIGPQKRLYIPAPMLREGTNEIIIFETEGKAAGEIHFYDASCDAAGQ